MNTWFIVKGVVRDASGNPVNANQQEQIVADANRLHKIRELMPEI